MSDTIERRLRGTSLRRIGNRRIASVVPTYQQMHIHHLTTFHQVVVNYCATPQLAQSSRNQRCIHIPDAVDDVTYCTALHELGHVLDSTQRHITVFDYFIGTPNVAYNEIGAWRWAQEHALWWTPEMEATKKYALGTYGIATTDGE
mgnify:CR=1 FL=1